MSQRVGLSIAVLIASVVLILIGTGNAQGVDPGERLMNANCLECHGIRVIQVQAMDAEAWTKRVSQEIERGAMLAPEDAPTLVNYLARRHGPLPNGPGKEVILNICTQCHDLFRIRLGRRSAEEWEETLVTMLNEGAPLSDEFFGLAHHYLSTNFGVD